jgi:hypothetical protein
MAEKAKENPGAVDQNKIKGDAENLAHGKGTPEAPRADKTPEAATATDVQSLAAAQQQPAAQQPAKVETLTQEDAEAKLDEQLKKEFGAGYVRAEKGGQKTTFTARAWELLGSNKEGWKPVTKKPAEVKALEEKQAANTAK